MTKDNKTYQYTFELDLEALANEQGVVPTPVAEVVVAPVIAPIILPQDEQTKECADVTSTEEAVVEPVEEVKEVQPEETVEEIKETPVEEPATVQTVEEPIAEEKSVEKVTEPVQGKKAKYLDVERYQKKQFNSRLSYYVLAVVFYAVLFFAPIFVLSGTNYSVLTYLLKVVVPALSDASSNLVDFAVTYGLFLVIALLSLLSFVLNIVRVIKHIKMLANHTALENSKLELEGNKKESGKIRKPLKRSIGWQKFVIFYLILLVLKPVVDAFIPGLGIDIVTTICKAIFLSNINSLYIMIAALLIVCGSLIAMAGKDTWKAGKKFKNLFATTEKNA